ncbi:MAG: triose-phosphate isomerase [Desulfobacca sp. RBG_16_60_12]|nr:MAG: triose-phosphate isomerase [Desulfobacca sp. RBG_16_60_12]
MAKRQPFIAGNWKMHKTLAEAKTLARDIRDGAAPGRRAEVALAPPYTALAAVAAELAGSDLRLAAQDAFWEKQGAFTGAISPAMLADVGCRYVIVGHSERRQLFGDTDAIVNKKLTAVVAAGLTPILCVGETKAAREADQTLKVVRDQLSQGLGELKPASGADLVIAYEPVWAIGTGLTATPDQAQTVHHFIRSLLREFLGPVAEAIRIQYGGSVTPDTAATLLAQPDIDGALVGGASLKPELFLPIIAAAG